MMRFEPTLIITRVVVRKNLAIAYDEKYHRGVNVIRGQNSSGKSTILNMIFYGLGGDLSDWSDAAKLCTTVQIEVEINGNAATLSREISSESRQPMEIFGGNYEASQKAARDQWLRYPYVRSTSKESFSQALFRLLGIPEVANDISGNLTMNQILRLLYADQLSPIEHLFRFETQFDSPLVRDAVGRLLCGAYDGELYQNEILIRTQQREFDTVSGELRSLYAVIGQTGESLTLDWIHAEQRDLQSKLAKMQVSIEEAERQMFVGVPEDEITLKAQEEAYKKVQELQEKLGKAKQNRDALSFEIADSAEFIASLKQKIDALRDSATIANHFKHVKFETCPACYSPLDEPDEAICHLCKTPFDLERAKGRIVAMVNDTAIQLKQSELLQNLRGKNVGELAANYARLELEWRSASQQLSQLQRLPSTDATDRLRALHRETGYLERQLEDLDRRRTIVEKLDQLSRRKEDLNGSIARLQTRNQALRASQERRLAQAYTAVADEVADLLRHDLRRQDAFVDPKRVEFDFSSNRITVDGQSYFSASSRVILKTSLIVGLLAAALKHEFFRHPRLCLIDTIEDKGMEPERSHNIQMQIARVSAANEVEHQIIFATVMIAPELNTDAYTVGEFSTLDKPTLKVG